MSLNPLLLRKNQLAILSLILVAYCLSMLGIASRLLNRGFDPMTQVYIRLFFALILSIIIFRKSLNKAKILSITHKDWFWFLVMGIFGYALSVYFITLASLNTKLVNVGVIFATAPFVVYVYSIFFLKEKIKSNAILLLLVSFIGVAIISTKSYVPILSSLGRGEFYALMSVLFYGWWSLGRKMLSSTLDNGLITVITLFIAFMTSFIVAMVMQEPLHLNAFLDKYVLLGVFIGSILNILVTYLENFAFGVMDLVLGNQILMLDNVFSLVNGFIFYGETISSVEIVGTLLVLAGVLLANRYVFKDG